MKFKRPILTRQQADGVTPMNPLEFRPKGRKIEPTSGFKHALNTIRQVAEGIQHA